MGEMALMVLEGRFMGDMVLAVILDLSYRDKENKVSASTSRSNGKGFAPSNLHGFALVPRGNTN
jgi:hypothetical protein